jgi:hypothetical protein
MGGGADADMALHNKSGLFAALDRSIDEKENQVRKEALITK